MAGGTQDSTSPDFQVREPEFPLPADALTVSEVMILNSAGDPSVALTRLDVRQTDSGVKLQTGILPTLTPSANYAPLRVSMEIFDHFDQAKLEIRLREGKAVGRLQNLKSRDVQGSLEISKMPFSEIYKLARRLNLVQDERDMGANWLDAQLTWSGKEKLVELSQILISGDIGSVGASNIAIRYAPKVLVTPFEAQLAPLRVDEILRILKIDEIQRLFVSAGEIVGPFRFTGDSMELKGALTKTVVLFTEDSKRSSLRVPSAEVFSKYLIGQSLRGSIAKIQIEKGAWKGGISWIHQFENAKTEFDIQADELQIPQGTLEPLLGLSVGALRGNAGIALDHGKITDVRFQLEAADIQSESISVLRPRLRGVFQKGRGDGRVSAEQILVSKSRPEASSLGAGPERDLVWRKFDGPLKYSADTSLVVGPVSFSGEVAGGELSGVLNQQGFEGGLVLRRVGSESRWGLGGKLQNLKLVNQ